MHQLLYITKIQIALDNTENDDSNITKLENAMDYFCGNDDICEGFKHAIMLTVNDQINNHASEQNPNDFEKLLELLK